MDVLCGGRCDPGGDGVSGIAPLQPSFNPSSSLLQHPSPHPTALHLSSPHYYGDCTVRLLTPGRPSPFLLLAPNHLRSPSGLPGRPLRIRTWTSRDRMESDHPSRIDYLAVARMDTPLPTLPGFRCCRARDGSPPASLCLGQRFRGSELEAPGRSVGGFPSWGLDTPPAVGYSPLASRGCGGPGRLLEDCPGPLLFGTDLARPPPYHLSSPPSTRQLRGEKSHSPKHLRY